MTEPLSNEMMMRGAMEGYRRRIAELEAQLAEARAELEAAKKRLEEAEKWRPISEMHEDFGNCVLIDVNSPGSIAIGNNLDAWYDETDWTHFSRIAPLTTEQAESLKAATGPRTTEDGK